MVVKANPFTITLSRSTHPKMSAYIDSVLNNPQYAVLSVVSLMAILIANYSFFVQDEKYPVLVPKKRFEWTNTRVVKEFLDNSMSLLSKARSMYGDQPISAYTDMGKVLVIPPSWVDALRGNKHLDFRIPAQEVSCSILVFLSMTKFEQDSHAYIPGFDGFSFHPNMPIVITKYITKALS